MSANRDGSRRFSSDHFYLAFRGAETNTLLFLGMPSKAFRWMLPSLFPLFSSLLFPSLLFEQSVLIPLVSSSTFRRRSLRPSCVHNLLPGGCLLNLLFFPGLLLFRREVMDWRCENSRRRRGGLPSRSERRAFRRRGFRVGRIGFELNQTTPLLRGFLTE